ncbi:MAG TPA: FkbM family methyltransferase [Flavisolibacter sp.]|jgi:FkbM family methyltransferase|nr:FkbM family methyltransferase [Flavisolibacter sp.]
MKFLFTKEKPLPHGVSEKELKKLRRTEEKTPGTITMDGRPFHYHAPLDFFVTYEEVILNEIYKFRSSSPSPYIIDCGANMGLSVFYFSQLYPGARIVAFEPEPPIFEVLQKNVQQFGQGKQIEIYQKAVWEEETTLQFYTDRGMGGSVVNTYKDQVPTEIKTVRLADFLQQQVDFLKLDIEGAEYVVLKDCAPYLKNVAHLFVEYHSFLNKEQKLEEILSILKQNGFRYHLRQSFSRNHPFVDLDSACENMDMAINVFGYR